MLNTLTRSAVARPLLLFLSITIGSSVAVGQNKDAASFIQPIPQPRQIGVKPGTFRLGNNTHIVLADPRSKDDRFAANDFSNDVQETAKLAIKTNTWRSRHSILIGNIELPSMQAALNRFGISQPADLDPEGYVLAVNANEVLIAGETPAGTFYGLQTLKQLVEDADEVLLRNEAKARRNRSMIPVMRFTAQRFDHLGRRMQVVQKFSQDYWDAYLNLSDRRKVGRLRNYWGNI